MTEPFEPKASPKQPAKSNKKCHDNPSCMFRDRLGRCNLLPKDCPLQRKLTEYSP